VNEASVRYPYRTCLLIGEHGKATTLRTGVGTPHEGFNAQTRVTPEAAILYRLLPRDLTTIRFVGQVCYNSRMIERKSLVDAQ
jgi:hypothetical protein